MPLPRWLAQLNRRTFNKLELKRGKRPVLVHTGRRSGATYHTPLDAFPVDDGYVFLVNYGPDSDWVRNVLAAGRADLRIGNETLALNNPQLLPRKDNAALLPASVRRTAQVMRVDNLLKMDIVPDGRIAPSPY